MATLPSEGNGKSVVWYPNTNLAYPNTQVLVVSLANTASLLSRLEPELYCRSHIRERESTNKRHGNLPIDRKLKKCKLSVKLFQNEL